MSTTHEVIRMRTLAGEEVAFYDDVVGQGTYKDCYLTPGGADVLLWFRDPVDAAQEQRYAAIAGLYRQSLLDGETGAYWRELFCWPRALVRYQERLGLVVPAYGERFRFTHGGRAGDALELKGKEKQSYWFVSLKHRTRTLDPRELGDWRGMLRMALLLARAVRRLHAAGLAHGDLSYKNVLADPPSGAIALIDLDGLIVPGKHPPEVAGTRDFVAPEVVASAGRAREQRVLPSMATDLHALAVLVYQYLLLRHPLRGDAVHDADDDERQESLLMGERACFVEDASGTNAVRADWLETWERPWRDPVALPYTVLGPQLAPLVQRAFGAGLHTPAARPAAEEWEEALVATADLLQPCVNASCTARWYVLDASRRECPFCRTPRSETPVPLLHFYRSGQDGRFVPEQKLFAGHHHAALHAWHGDRLLRPSERLTAGQKTRRAYLAWQDGQWLLVNEGFALSTVPTTLAERRRIGTGEALPITDGTKLHFEESGRLAIVQLLQ